MSYNRFPHLSSPSTEIEDVYDVVVIGSGYGGSIAASRCARAGQKVCLLERGKEWLPGEFPEGFVESASHVQIAHEGKKGIMGDPTDLYEFNVSKDITVIQGCGLGGGSLINANVGLDADKRVFDLPEWPKELKDDMENLMAVDKQHVMEMLRPTAYPDSYPKLPKMQAMKDAAEKLAEKLPDVEDLEDIFKKTPLYVNFDGSKPNPVGIHQPACNGCGNCCGGCNTGAKNTLNMNYIPDAVAHGAHVFTQIAVTSVVRDSFSSLWRVYFSRKIPNGGFHLNENIVRAKYVVLGAGSLGSTKILLESKNRGLKISEKVGHNFSGNGDVIGFCYNADKELNAIGAETGMYDKVQTTSPGPTITAAIDLRRIKGQTLKEGMILEDGTSPSVINIPYSVTMAIANKLIGVKSISNRKTWHKLYQKVNGQGAMDKTMGFLGMSHDDSEGKIWLDQKTNQVHISWKGVGRQKNFEKVNKQMENVSLEMGGTFIRNPMWSDSFGKDLVCAHPLGGCCMGNNGKEGVVNHKGQVFIGDSSEVYPCLYVMDGAVLPTAVGVNPTMTISMVAERLCRLMAKDAGWTIDYALNKHLDPDTFKKRKPGLRFTERMVGSVNLQKDINGHSKQFPCEFTVTIESQDLEKMLDTDPEHSAEITGTVTCPGLSPEPLQVQEGAKFQLFKDSEEIVDAKEMVYKMFLLSATGEEFYLEGIKKIKKDKFGEIGLEDTTTLFVKIFECSRYERNQIGNGILNIKFFDFMKQLQTMEVLNVHSEMEQIKWKAKFSGFFAKTLWNTYSGFSRSSLFDPNAPPRKLRPLNLGSVVPELFAMTTEDQVDLKLTRYNGGSKGPLLVSPGMAMTANAFALDTVSENFVEYMVRHHYDIWLFDWRGSPDLPWACYGQYTIDDVGQYDFPAAVDKILEVTGEKDVQIIAHCVSSLSLFASLLSGRLDGKVRSIVASQVSATPVGSNYSAFKAKFHIPGFLRDVGHVEALTAYTDTKADFKSKMFNSLCKLISEVITSSDDDCTNVVCHRLTAVYGLLYEHVNLNAKSHDVLHEMFGSGSISYFTQLTKLFRKQKLVSASGKDIYLPKMEKKNRLEYPEYKKNINHLNVPICFLYGEENSVFDVDSHIRTRDLLMEAHPSQHYEMVTIPAYGHIDVFIGKNASRDVYPKLLRFLDKYSEDKLVKNTDYLNQVHLLLNEGNLAARKNAGQNEEHHLRKRLRSQLSNSADERMDESDYPLQLQDAPLNQVDNILEQLDLILPNEKVQIWKKKESVKSCFHKEKQYLLPLGNDVEKVVVEEYFLHDETEKREIFVLSDLHLGGTWSEKIGNKLRAISTTLAKVAEYNCHSIVLLGDIVEMWQTPVTTSPPTKKKFLAQWEENKDIEMFARAISKMAEDDDVKVFYVRGNHDHEITEDIVHSLFGHKVRFVPGTLVYIIDNGVSKQRIRFEHGHDYDLFNSYSILPENLPSRGLPIGYYVSRSTVTSDDKYMSDMEKVMNSVLHYLISNIPSWLLGSTIIEMLSLPALSRKLLENLFEVALNRDIGVDDAVVMTRQDSVTDFDTLVEFPFIRRVAEEFGSSRTFAMLKASLGDWSEFLREMNEDVVVLGHSHHWKNEVRHGKHGNLHYVNSGTLIDFADQFSFARLSPPKHNEDGFIEVNFETNDQCSLSGNRSRGS